MGTLIRAAAIEQGARDLGTLRKMKDISTIERISSRP
jgi:hypothetical protein